MTEKHLYYFTASHGALYLSILHVVIIACLVAGLEFAVCLFVNIPLGIDSLLELQG